MRSLFLLFAAAASLMSCTSTHYHLTTFAPPEGYTGEKPHIRQHEAVTVEYNFAGPGNRMNFQVHNTRNKDLFIDFSRSSLIVNSLSLPYFHSTTETTMQIQTSGMPLWTENLSLLSLSGTSNGGTMGSVVMIPAGTRVHFQRIELPVPLLPNRDQQLEQGLIRVHPVYHEAKVGSTYRHRLAFIPENPTNEAFFIEDSFVVKTNRLVPAANFQHDRVILTNPESLTSISAREMIDSGGTVIGLMTSIVAAVLIYEVMKEED